MGQHYFTPITPYACPQLQLPTNVTTVIQTTALACPQSQIPTRVKQLARFYVITVVVLRTGALLELTAVFGRMALEFQKNHVVFTSMTQRHNVRPQETSIRKIIYAANTVSLNNTWTMYTYGLVWNSRCSPWTATNAYQMFACYQAEKLVYICENNGCWRALI